MSLRLLYETKFGIRDHVNNDSPFGPVAMHDAENMSHWGETRNRIKIVLSSGVLNKVNMSLTDFLNLPKNVVDMILEENEVIRQKEIEQQNDLTKQLQQG